MWSGARSSQGGISPGTGDPALVPRPDTSRPRTASRRCYGACACATFCSNTFLTSRWTSTCAPTAAPNWKSEAGRGLRVGRAFSRWGTPTSGLVQSRLICSFLVCLGGNSCLNPLLSSGPVLSGSWVPGCDLSPVPTRSIPCRCLPGWNTPSPGRTLWVNRLSGFSNWHVLFLCPQPRDSKLRCVGLGLGRGLSF